MRSHRNCSSVGNDLPAAAATSGQGQAVAASYNGSAVNQLQSQAVAMDQFQSHWNLQWRLQQRWLP